MLKINNAIANRSNVARSGTEIEVKFPSELEVLGRLV